MHLISSETLTFERIAALLQIKYHYNFQMKPKKK
jgi:hypothetical protein